MDKSKLVTLFCDLNAINFADDGINHEELCRQNCKHVMEILKCLDDDIMNIEINEMFDSKNTFEWKYICLNFYVLELLNTELSKSEENILSVQEKINVKTSLGNLVLVGILKNLQPNLPHRVVSEKNNQVDVLYQYNLLKCTTFGLYNSTKHPNLRMLILPHFLSGMLVATYQIAHGPLKKPTKNSSECKFVMNEETYQKLLKDQERFRKLLEDMKSSIHPSIFIKETLLLLQADAPIWFKKSVSSNLTKIMLGKKGVERVASAMLDGQDNDTTTTWKTIDVLTKLVMSCRQLPDFQNNVLRQVVKLLDLTKTVSNRESLLFERLVVSCAKSVYSADKELCKVVFLEEITSAVEQFASKEHKFRDGDDVTDGVQQTARLISDCFGDSTCLPVELLKSLINVLFHLYHLSVKSALRATSDGLRGVLMKYLRCCSAGEIHQLLDGLLFGGTVTDVAQFRNDIALEMDTRIVVRTSPHVVVYDVVDTVYDLLDTDGKIILFGYLLMCISEKERYFPETGNSKELLGDEEHATSTVLGKLLTIHKLLSQLAENKDVQHSLRDKPDDIIRYIHGVLVRGCDDDLLFVTVMILDNLVSNSSIEASPKFNILTESLMEISAKTKNSELRSLGHKIASALNAKTPSTKQKNIEGSELEKALEDISDPLLPVRGHGLLTLTKLIEKKDKDTMHRKQYLLNLLQLHLKDEDSFIYLNAVQGLAALADAFPDTVLDVLCEEFAEFAKKDSETRLKVGEVLVRVVKTLGEMAPKYKPQLLNTFLAGTRDDDHLVRASSLSNLGEVCRVLHYKLGSIVSEVLVCVHAIIATDKAVEARRAAVTVIRQLFAGLQAETVAFLKEDILQVYRTLKDVYYNDRDEVMRLQAQLALEELNENVKQFVLPKPTLHVDKKIVMLD